MTMDHNNRQHGEDEYRKVARRSGEFARPALFVIGTLCVILGIVGIVLPLLPTTPFLLIAAACYAKSSERFHDWLLEHRWFGGYIRDFRSGNGIPIRAKVVAVLTLWTSITFSALFVLNLLVARVALFVVASGVTIYILSLKTSS